jgi:hypothetical protein
VNALLHAARTLELAGAAAACIGLEVAGEDVLETPQTIQGLEIIDRYCEIDASMLIAILAERRNAERPP